MVDLSQRTTIGVCETQSVTAAGVRAVLNGCQDLEFCWSVSTLAVC